MIRFPGRWIGLLRKRFPSDPDPLNPGPGEPWRQTCKFGLSPPICVLEESQGTPRGSPIDSQVPTDPQVRGFEDRRLVMGPQSAPDSPPPSTPPKTGAADESR